MPSLQLTCPHCETLVPIQVTAVTRSRHCPSCQRQLLLQVNSRGGLVRLKAHLLGLAQGLVPQDPLPEPVAVEQRPSASTDPNHPEWMQLKRHLMLGAATCVGMILMLTTLRLCRKPQTASPRPDSAPAAIAKP